MVRQGIVASYKFIQKLWGLHCKIKSILDGDNNYSNPDAEVKITKFTHRLIEKRYKQLRKI